MKFLPGIQDIHQIMADPLHFLRADLGGTNIHIFIHLHGICGDDRSVQFLCKCD